MRKVVELLILIFGIALLIISLYLPDASNRVKKQSDRFLFIFDITRSMTAEDYKWNGQIQSRLDMAKKSALKIAESLSSDSLVSIGSFAGKKSAEKSFRVFLPSVNKQENFKDITQAIESVDWKNSWDDGSDLLVLIKNLKDEVTADTTTAIIFTDGGEENIDNLSIDSSAGNNNNLKLFFVGVGGAEPAYIPDFDSWGERSIDYMKSPSGAYFTSSLNDVRLKKLSDSLGAKYQILKSEDDLRLLTSIIAGENYSHPFIFDFRKILIGLALALFILSKII